MKLIEPLCNGFSDAPSGTATIYLAGTTTPATVYTGANATGGTSGTAGVHTLTALGRKVLYTNERLDITVKTAAGATVATFTVGDHAKVTRYAPSTGWSTSGGFTVVSTALDSIATSIGGTDAKTSDGRYIKDILGPSKKTFDVTTYGAVGDGAADDTTALQAAINAADAISNGQVFFPPGTYRITSGLTGTAAALIGVPGSSEITVSASFSGDMYSRATSGTFVSGIEFEMQNAASTGSCIKASDPTVVTVERCAFRPASGIGVEIASNSAGRVRITDCDFYLTQAAARAAETPGLNSSTCIIRDPYVSISTGLTYPAFYLNCTIVGGYFGQDAAGSTALSAGGSMTSALISAGSGATLSMSGDDYSFSEAGNVLIASASTILSIDATGVIAAHRSTSFRYEKQDVSGTTLTPDPRRAGIWRCAPTGNLTVAAPTASFDGAVLEIVVRNTSGGVVTLTWNAVYKGTPTGSLNNTQAIRALFVYDLASLTWIGHGTLTAFTS